MATNGGLSNLSGLEQSLRDTLRKEAADPVRQMRALEIQKEAWGRQVSPHQAPLTMPTDMKKDDATNFDDRALKDKEAEIKRRKAEVEVRVKAQADRVQAEAKQLDQLRRELDTMEDPTKKEVADLRRKIEIVDRELRPMKAICERKRRDEAQEKLAPEVRNAVKKLDGFLLKERELKDALTLYNDKNAQKAELVGKLFEIVTESEKQRLKKLEELNMLLQDMEGR